MRHFFSEFRDFLMRGNLMNLAVAFIMGAAFTTLIKALVNDIMMPLIGIFTQSASFNDITWQIGAAKIQIGAFIGDIITFILTGLAVFLMVKAFNKVSALTKLNKSKDEDKVDTELSLLKEIRDSLTTNSNNKIGQ